MHDIYDNFVLLQIYFVEFEGELLLNYSIFLCFSHTKHIQNINLSLKTKIKKCFRVEELSHFCLNCNCNKTKILKNCLFLITFFFFKERFNFLTERFLSYKLVKRAPNSATQEQYSNNIAL